MASGLGWNKRELVLRKRRERTLISALLGGSGRAIWRVGLAILGGKESGDSVEEAYSRRTC